MAALIPPTNTDRIFSQGITYTPMFRAQANDNSLEDCSPTKSLQGSTSSFPGNSSRKFLRKLRMGTGTVRRSFRDQALDSWHVGSRLGSLTCRNTCLDRRHSSCNYWRTLQSYQLENPQNQRNCELRLPRTLPDRGRLRGSIGTSEAGWFEPAQNLSETKYQGQCQPKC